MACLYPKPFHQNAEALKFRWPGKFGYRKGLRPCGQCQMCRASKRLDWAVRNWCEFQQHGCAAFVTLTYAKEHRPGNPLSGYTLDPDHVSAFMKRLRRYVQYAGHDVQIRFFATGEYGGKGPGHHPHYHILIYGFDFPDKKYAGKSKKGHKCYKSPLLSKAWKYGFADIGTVNWDSIQYVAGYVTKKINGDQAESHYRGNVPEFSRSSNKPGIGMDWARQNKENMLQLGYIQIGDKQRHIPKAFMDKVIGKDAGRCALKPQTPQHARPQQPCSKSLEKRLQKAVKS